MWKILKPIFFHWNEDQNFFQCTPKIFCYKIFTKLSSILKIQCNLIRHFAFQSEKQKKTLTEVQFPHTFWNFFALELNPCQVTGVRIKRKTCIKHSKAIYTCWGKKERQDEIFFSSACDANAMQTFLMTSELFFHSLPLQMNSKES